MKGTPLNDQLFEYIVHNFAEDERALLEKMSARAQAAGIPMIMISEEQARFIGVFLRAIKARRVLDVGTLFGYSAAIMSSAVGAEGEIISLEFAEKHARVARENLDELGIKNVSITTGPALDAMKIMPESSFDFILIDADKPNYSNYLNESLRLIRPGGVIAGDNALAWGKIASDLPKADPDYASVRALQQFNHAFAQQKAIFGVICAIGDGMAIGVVSK
ncbi:MAG: O-methyltransferase [Bacteroidota bacterium]|nr:O-methyltransferase [Bacteroidota bacterium]MDP4234021.1 O-methyltransferase [Bacteroidota bacterium]MDP4242887.1 O-methyltransferase [Bacteroidota bacterium]MDP4287674.1 O-methyltransferase [Bacteroidota bacterium]